MDDSGIGSCNNDFSNLSVETGSKPNQVTGFKPNLETSSKTSLETGFKPYLEIGSKPNLETSSKTSMETGFKPNLGTDSKPSLETGSKPSLETSFNCFRCPSPKTSFNCFKPFKERNFKGSPKLKTRSKSSPRSSTYQRSNSSPRYNSSSRSTPSSRCTPSPRSSPSPKSTHSSTCTPAPKSSLKSRSPLSTPKTPKSVSYCHFSTFNGSVSTDQRQYTAGPSQDIATVGPLAIPSISMNSSSTISIGTVAQSRSTRAYSPAISGSLHGSVSPNSPAFPQSASLSEMARTNNSGVPMKKENEQKCYGNEQMTRRDEGMRSNNDEWLGNENDIKNHEHPNTMERSEDQGFQRASPGFSSIRALKVSRVASRISRVPSKGAPKGPPRVAIARSEVATDVSKVEQITGQIVSKLHIAVTGR